MKSPRPIGRRVSLLSLANDLFKKIEQFTSGETKLIEDIQRQENPPARFSSSFDNNLR